MGSIRDLARFAVRWAFHLLAGLLVSFAWMGETPAGLRHDYCGVGVSDCVSFLNEEDRAEWDQMELSRSDEMQSWVANHLQDAAFAFRELVRLRDQLPQDARASFDGCLQTVRDITQATYGRANSCLTGLEVGVPPSFRDRVTEHGRALSYHHRAASSLVDLCSVTLRAPCDRPELSRSHFFRLHHERFGLMYQSVQQRTPSGPGLSRNAQGSGGLSRRGQGDGGGGDGEGDGDERRRRRRGPIRRSTSPQQGGPTAVGSASLGDVPGVQCGDGTQTVSRACAPYVEREGSSPTRFANNLPAGLPFACVRQRVCRAAATAEFQAPGVAALDFMGNSTLGDAWLGLEASLRMALEDRRQRLRKVLIRKLARQALLFQAQESGSRPCATSAREFLSSMNERLTGDYLSRNRQSRGCQLSPTDRQEIQTELRDAVQRVFPQACSQSQSPEFAQQRRSQANEILQSQCNRWYYESLSSENRSILRTAAQISFPGLTQLARSVSAERFRRYCGGEAGVTRAQAAIQRARIAGEGDLEASLERRVQCAVQGSGINADAGLDDLSLQSLGAISRGQEDVSTRRDYYAGRARAARAARDALDLACSDDRDRLTLDMLEAYVGRDLPREEFERTAIPDSAYREMMSCSERMQAGNGTRGMLAAAADACAYLGPLATMGPMLLAPGLQIVGAGVNTLCLVPGAEAANQANQRRNLLNQLRRGLGPQVSCEDLDEINRRIAGEENEAATQAVMTLMQGGESVGSVLALLRSPGVRTAAEGARALEVEVASRARAARFVQRGEQVTAAELRENFPELFRATSGIRAATAEEAEQAVLLMRNQGWSDAEIRRALADAAESERMGRSLQACPVR